MLKTNKQKKNETHLGKKVIILNRGLGLGDKMITINIAIKLFLDRITVDFYFCVKYCYTLGLLCKM